MLFSTSQQRCSLSKICDHSSTASFNDSDEPFQNALTGPPVTAIADRHMATNSANKMAYSTAVGPSSAQISRLIFPSISLSIVSKLEKLRSRAVAEVSYLQFSHEFLKVIASCGGLIVTNRLDWFVTEGRKKFFRY